MITSRKISIGILTTLVMVFLSGCCMPHAWQDATCTEPAICAECGKTKGEAAGHTWEDATCTEPAVCAECGETTGEAAGHTWTETACTEPRTCSVCGVEEKAPGHTWTDATCTEPRTCSVCGATVGPAAGHEWVSATCTEPEKCSVCEETQGEAAGHDWREATCLKAKNCYRCGETEGEALGHELDDFHACIRCREYMGTGTLYDFSDVRVYDTLTFGRYDQDGVYGNGKEDIEWIVLDKQEDKLLVLSKSYLDRQPYHGVKDSMLEEVNWENSTIRNEFLNNTFLYTAFSEAERNVILDTVIDEPGCGGPTTDKIFLLSYDEYVTYCSEKKAVRDGRKSPRYGEENKYCIYGMSYDGWLLRAKIEEELEPGSGGEKRTEQYILVAGSLSGDVDLAEGVRRWIISVSGTPPKDISQYTSYIRPAMWIPTVSEIIEEKSEDAKRIPQVDLAALHIGDRFTFGAYEMNGDYRDGKEPLEWYVLSKSDDSILAINVYGFSTHNGDFGPDRMTYEELVTWSLQRRTDWLDYEFYREGFSEAEKELIIPWPKHAPYVENAKGGGFVIRDWNGEYVHILTKKEYEKYFSFDAGIPIGATTWSGYAFGGWGLADIMGGVGDDGRIWGDSDNIVGTVENYVRPVISIQIEGSGQETEEGTKVQVGDLIEFGSYEQDNDLANGKEPISWRVIDRREDQVLVISDQVLDHQSYHSVADGEEPGRISWADCLLRAWLNQDFYEEAFTSEEKERIIQVETSGDLTTFDTGHAMTESYDHVFCLSKDEVNRYGYISADATPYAEAQGLVPFGTDGEYGYWIRDKEESYAAFKAGEVGAVRQTWNTPFVGVRPAMWIKLP